MNVDPEKMPINSTVERGYPHYSEQPQAPPLYQQPPPVQSQPVPQHRQIVLHVIDPMKPRGIPRPWTSPATGCCDDMQICLMSTFVPFYSCCVAAEMGENMCVPFCVPASPIAMRALVRARHNIEGNLMNDCLMTCCLPCCSECQLAREIKYIKEGKALP
ncbi:uncharacterized protein [Diadema setosum]|uniref:uncharacterized protein n=1 Tax=Diadema setosum TaxID=31175 RepID=UPI003B3BA1F1